MKLIIQTDRKIKVERQPQTIITAGKQTSKKVKYRITMGDLHFIGWSGIVYEVRVQTMLRHEQHRMMGKVRDRVESQQGKKADEQPT